MTSGVTAGAASKTVGLLVGYGSIGRRHLTNLHALGVQDWAVVHTGTGTLAFEPPGPVRSYPDLPAALTSEAPTFAVIANPSALHLDAALACADQGCALLVEKPVSHSLDGLDALIDAVDARGNSVLVGFQFRFDPGLRKVAETLRSGSVGAPIHARVVWGEYLPDWHPWEDWRVGYAARRDLGGGVHHTLSHPFDYLRMLFGDPTELTASLVDDGPLGLEVAEGADVRLRFDGGDSSAGVTAQVHLDYWSRPAVHRVEITCTNGTIVWDYVGGRVQTWDAATATWDSEAVPGVEARDDLFRMEARHFLEVLLNGVEPACSLHDGVQAARVCAAIERSAAAGARMERP